jgi:hypothetical protein
MVFRLEMDLEGMQKAISRRMGKTKESSGSSDFV